MVGDLHPTCRGLSTPGISLCAAPALDGDFHDSVEMPGQPGHMGLVIADVVERGVPTALLRALGRTSFRSMP
jgi:hypothetical protein